MVWSIKVFIQTHCSRNQIWSLDCSNIDCTHLFSHSQQHSNVQDTSKQDYSPTLPCLVEESELGLVIISKMLNSNYALMWDTGSSEILPGMHRWWWPRHQEVLKVTSLGGNNQSLLSASLKVCWVPQLFQEDHCRVIQRSVFICMPISSSMGDRPHKSKGVAWYARRERSVICHFWRSSSQSSLSFLHGCCSVCNKLIIQPEPTQWYKCVTHYIENRMDTII